MFQSAVRGVPPNVFVLLDATWEQHVEIGEEEPTQTQRTTQPRQHKQKNRAGPNNQSSRYVIRNHRCQGFLTAISLVYTTRTSWLSATHLASEVDTATLKNNSRKDNSQKVFSFCADRTSALSNRKKKHTRPARANAMLSGRGLITRRGEPPVRHS